MASPTYKMSINLNILNHLGLKLYSNVPAVLSEAVANSWDADAENVRIEITPDKITITDDGHGIDLPPMFVPPVMLVRQARGQGRQARGPQAPAAGSPANCAA